LNQCLTTVQVDAFVVDERVLDEKMIPLSSGGGFLERVVLRARVLDRSSARDRDFTTEVKLPRDRFLDGEEVSLSIRSSRDARLYVLNITKDGATLLLPNAHLTDTRAFAKTWLAFPSDALRERGVRLSVQVPAGEKSAREALLVVAVRGDRELGGLSPASGEAFRATEANGAGVLLADLLSPLFDLPADAWTFDQASYEVLAR
jgi:hypothetical protein